MKVVEWMNGETRWKRRQGETRELWYGPQEAKELEDPTLPSPALGFLPPATMASRSPSRFGRIRMNSCRRKGATSVLLFTNIRTGFFKDTEARSLTCQAQRQACSSACQEASCAGPRPHLLAQPGVLCTASPFTPPRRNPTAHLICHRG